MAGKKTVIKKSGVRKTKGKGKPWYSKKYSALDLAGKAWTGVKMLKGIINSEKKYHDTLISGSVDYNGTINLLTDIDQGDTNVTRSGNSILAKSLLIRYSVIPDVSSANTSYMRVIICQDTMNLGTTPAVSDVLQNTASASAPLSHYNNQYSAQYRFKILYDKTHGLSNLQSTPAYVSEKLMVNDHIKYTGTQGTDEGKNNIYLVLISNQVTSLLPAFSCYSRVKFYDN